MASGLDFQSVDALLDELKVTKEDHVDDAGADDRDAETCDIVVSAEVFWDEDRYGEYVPL